VIVSADDDEDSYDVSAQAESAMALKQQKKTEPDTTSTYDIVRSYLKDGTTAFAELRETTRDDHGKNMLRMLAKTLMTNTVWTMDYDDPSIPPKHLSQVKRWMDIGQAPQTTYNIKPVEIAALALSEVAGNSIIPTLPGMPNKSAEWYQESGMELMDTLGVQISKIPATVRMFWKNSISNRAHYLFSAAVAKKLGETSPATDAKKQTPRSPGSIPSSAASKASTLGSAGVTHHLSSLSVKPRNIVRILEKDAATADGKTDDDVDRDTAKDDDDTGRRLDGEYDIESNHSQAAEDGTEEWGETEWTDEQWSGWIARGCPDRHGITVPVGPTDAALEPHSVQHRPTPVLNLAEPNPDISVGMKDPDDPRKWADLFY
jgi:hypothetical protein